MTETRQTVNRRAELLDAAREIFAEKGVDATRVSEIVARAGVAQGTFYLYFPSKLSLLMALTEQIYAEIQREVAAAVASSTTLRAQIERGVTAAFGVIECYGDIFGVVYPRAGGSEDRGEAERLFAPYYELVAATIRAGQRRGEMDLAIRPEVSARLIVGLIDSAAESCYVRRTGIPASEYIAEVTRFIERALGAA